MLPDLRLLIPAIIASFFLAAGGGLYASMKLIQSQAVHSDTPNTRIFANWPVPEPDHSAALREMAALALTPLSSSSFVTEAAVSDAPVMAATEPELDAGDLEAMPAAITEVGVGPEAEAEVEAEKTELAPDPDPAAPAEADTLSEPAAATASAADAIEQSAAADPAEGSGTSATLPESENGAPLPDSAMLAAASVAADAFRSEDLQIEISRPVQVVLPLKKPKTMKRPRRIIQHRPPPAAQPQPNTKNPLGFLFPQSRQQQTRPTAPDRAPLRNS